MQTSSRSLPAAQKKTLASDLCTVLADLKNPHDLEVFVADFFTPTEQTVFAKRLQIAWLLNQGLSYEEIKAKLHVSSATISSVAVVKDKPGFQKALKVLKIDAWADRMATTVMRWFSRPSAPSTS
jgi:uncharacterized protein YerC